MQTLTFSCPLCGRRMGVGADLLGRPVRCPSCREIIVAPSGSSPGNPATDPAASPDFSLPPPDPTDSLFHGSGPAGPEPLPHPFALPTALKPPLDPTGPHIQFGTEPPQPDHLGSLVKRSAARPVLPPPPDVGRLKLAIRLLLVYAVLATLVAVYAWFRRGEYGHPWANIPDFFGEYDRADRGKVSSLGLPSGELPVDLRIPLGRSRVVGLLEVAPLAVEERRPTAVTVRRGPDAAPTRQRLDRPILVLRLRLRNLSPDASFCPVDPAYNRRRAAGDAPLTGLVLGRDGGERLPGGPIPWPYESGVARVWVDGQEENNRPLRPGEEREYLICSADDPGLVETVCTARGPVTWQVHLRRGLATFQRRDVSVGAVVGVEFAGDQVRRLPVRQPG